MTVKDLKKELSKYKSHQIVKIMDSSGTAIDICNVYSPSDYDYCNKDDEDKDTVFIDM